MQALYRILIPGDDYMSLFHAANKKEPSTTAFENNPISDIKEDSYDDSIPTSTVESQAGRGTTLAKEKTALLLHTAGFQNAYRIEQSDYIGSISYKNDEVKLFKHKKSSTTAEANTS